MLRCFAKAVPHVPSAHPKTMETAVRSASILLAVATASCRRRSAWAGRPRDSRRDGGATVFFGANAGAWRVLAQTVFPVHPTNAYFLSSASRSCLAVKPEGLTHTSPGRSPGWASPTEPTEPRRGGTSARRACSCDRCVAPLGLALSMAASFPGLRPISAKVRETSPLVDSRIGDLSPNSRTSHMVSALILAPMGLRPGLVCCTPLGCIESPWWDRVAWHQQVLESRMNRFSLARAYVYCIM